MVFVDSKRQPSPDVWFSYTCLIFWCLPASKTDVKALSATRVHRCICEAHSTLATICPFHLAKEYLDLLAALFGEAGDEDALPLFPTCKGAGLSHTATVASLRAVASALGEPLTRDAGGSVLQRFGEHVMRVSGAQLLARIQVDLFVIQLIGRWGSMAITRYVQEAPLAAGILQAPRSTSLEDVSALIRTHVGPSSSRDVQLEDTIATLTSRLDAIEPNLEALKVKVATVLADTGPRQLSLVQKPASQVFHAILLGPSEGVSTQLCIARCGWSFGLTPHSLVAAAPTGSRRCRRCFRG